MARAVARHGAAERLTDADWAALRTEPCGMCGEPYHRFCDHDPEHEWDAVACINSLRDHIADLEEAKLRASSRPKRRWPR